MGEINDRRAETNSQAMEGGKDKPRRTKNKTDPLSYDAKNGPGYDEDIYYNNKDPPYFNNEGLIVKDDDSIRNLAGE